MARAVVCPNCRDELDIPDELYARPVKCAACATVFTPAEAAGPPVARRASRDPDDDDVRRPRREPSGFQAKPHRVLFGTMGLLLAGTFGVCCVGCVGLVAVGVRLDNPPMQDYRDPAGRFAAQFPGPPTPVSMVFDDGEAAGVGHTRTVLGEPFDACSVQVYELPRAPQTDAARDAALIKYAGELVDAQGGMTQKSLTKTTLYGYPAVEVVAEAAGDDTALYGRVVLAGKRVYFVTYDGNGLAPESQRLQAFWAGFRILDPAAKGD